MALQATNHILQKVVGASTSNLETAFCGVEFDSRRIKGGELFIALRGDHSHGHDFVEEALRKGAALCLVEIEAAIENCDSSLLCSVPDTLKAFGDLARWWRRKLATPLLAVTGSVGKTTVKEMAACILLKTGPGHYSEGSFNNHTGVPYTLCQLSASHQWGVIEIGMNHAGEIANLTALVEPNVALITKIAPAHIEFFGSLSAIAEAKLEIVQGLKLRSSIVLNGDDEVLLEAFSRLKTSLHFEQFLFGYSEGVNVQISKGESKGLEGIAFELNFNQSSIAVKMPSIGLHHATNAAAAAAGALSLASASVSSDIIQQALISFKPPQQRGTVLRLNDGREILDESYNANPASMTGVIEVAKTLLKLGKNTGLLLGDMLELGVHSSEAHADIAQQLVLLKPSFVIGVGSFFESVIEKLSASGVTAQHYMSPREAVFNALNHAWDVLIVKSSKGVGLYRLKEFVAEHQIESSKKG
jgi:UDP-N-acetylmuramoyl-tripeptide--D-alanyl-D-alanine ligase